MVKMFHTICTAMQQQCYRLILSTNKVKIIILGYKYSKYTDTEKQQCNMLSDYDDDDDD